MSDDKLAFTEHNRDTLFTSDHRSEMAYQRYMTSSTVTHNQLTRCSASNEDVRSFGGSAVQGAKTSTQRKYNIAKVYS